MNDIKFAFRQLLKAPAFSLIALTTLALGIGANTAIFSVLNTLLFRPLPFQNPDQLVWISNITCCGLSGETTRVKHLQEWQRLNRSFEDLAAYFAFFDYGSYTLLNSGEPERLSGVGVSQNFLPALGVPLKLGRNFTTEEAQWNGPKAIMLTHAFWQRRFGSDPNVVGKVLTLNNEPHSIVGVLPVDFDFSSTFVPGSKVDLIVPFPLSRETDAWGNTLAIIGRLKPGVKVADAQAELNLLTKQIQTEFPQYGTSWGARVIELREKISGRFRSPLWVLFAAVGCVMLIACTNLSNLLLVKTAGRSRELAVRVALGASRLRIARQLFTESILLALIGAVLGIPLAGLLLKAVCSTSAFSIPLLESVRIDGPVLVFTVLAALLTGIAFGIAPALQVSQVVIQENLKDGARGTSGGKRSGRLRQVLVAWEVGLACVLLIGAGLLIRSFERLLEVDPGFRAEQAMAWRIETSRPFKSNDERVAYYNEMSRRIKLIQGVESVGFSDTLPLGRNRTWGIGAKGKDYPPGEYPTAYPRIVSAGYLEAMLIRIKAGRYFTAADSKDNERVIVLNEKAAQVLWPNENPIEKIVRVGRDEWKVIGITENVRHSGLDEAPGLEMYLPMTQTDDFSAVELVIRTTGAPAPVVANIRSVLREIDATLPIANYVQLEQLVDQAVSPKRFVMLLLTGFSLLALLLASLGIYGVLSYSVTQRTQEIGIRMAIGAQTSNIMKLILSEGIILALVGIAGGIVAAFILTPLMRGLLFGIPSYDPITFGANAIILFSVAILACYIPARRASRISPNVALRQE